MIRPPQESSLQDAGFPSRKRPLRGERRDGATSPLLRAPKINGGDATALPVQRFIVSGTLLLLGLVTTMAAADVVHLNSAADTFLLDTAPTNNNGGTEGITVGRDDNGGIRRGLIQFDLSGIPPGSTITSAVLELTVTKDPPQPVDTNFHLFKVLHAWGEGDKVGFRPGNSGAPATAGEASWDERLTGVAAWSTPGALDDAAPAASGTTFIEGAGAYAWTNAGVATDVQFWVDHPAQNFGWLIVCADELTPMTARKFGSREFTPNPQPPILQVGFVPGLYLSAPTAVATSTFQFTVNTLASTTNVVEATTDLSNPSAWIPLETRVPTNNTFILIDTNATDSHRLYRVRRP